MADSKATTKSIRQLYYRLHQEEQRQAARVRRKEWRSKLFELLGNKCVRCGYTDIRALQLDHINSDGYIDRRSKNGSYCNNSGSPLYYKLIADIDDTKMRFQLLCANCNWIKREENNEYGNNSKAMKVRHSATRPNNQLVVVDGCAITLYQRANSPYWQTRLCISRNIYRTSTKTDDLDKARLYAIEWYYRLLATKKAATTS